MHFKVFVRQIFIEAKRSTPFNCFGFACSIISYKLWPFDYKISRFTYFAFSFYLWEFAIFWVPITFDNWDRMEYLHIGEVLTIMKLNLIFRFFITLKLLLLCFNKFEFTYNFNFAIVGYFKVNMTPIYANKEYKR